MWKSLYSTGNLQQHAQFHECPLVHSRSPVVVHGLLLAIVSETLKLHDN